MNAFSQTNNEIGKRIKIVLFIIITILYIAQVIPQMHGFKEVAVADSIGYIISGINLVSTGHYTNPFGGPEVWFPPVYPFLIGILNLLGGLEAVLSARLISFIAGAASLYFIYVAARKLWGIKTGIFASLLLLSNPTFQFLSSYALSEVLAAMFAIWAFSLWLQQKSNSEPAKSYAKIGILLALATLTRPEYVILFLTWISLDFLFAKRVKSSFIAARIFACISFAILVIPYALYLQDKTGNFSISHKGDVNLTQGLADHYSGPREIIDATTFEITFQTYPVDLASEINRYVTNIGKIWQGYNEIYFGYFAYILVIFCIISFVAMFRNKQYKLLLGTLAGFGYLSILAYYSVQPRYLYGTIPFICFASSHGLSLLLNYCNNIDSKNRALCIKLTLFIMLGFFMCEGYTRHPRWTFNAPPTNAEFLKDSGTSMRESINNDCVMYDWGATVGYYAGCRRGRLTSDDLGKTLKYILADKGNSKAFLVYFSGYENFYHSTINPDYLNVKSNIVLINSYQYNEHKLNIYSIQSVPVD